MSTREVVFLSLAGFFLLVFMAVSVATTVREFARTSADHRGRTWRVRAAVPWWALAAGGLAGICLDLAVPVGASIAGLIILVSALWSGYEKDFRIFGAFDEQERAHYPELYRPVEHPASDAPQDQYEYAPDAEEVWRKGWFNLALAFILWGAAYSLLAWGRGRNTEWGMGGMILVIPFIVLLAAGGGAALGFVLAMVRHAALRSRYPDPGAPRLPFGQWVQSEAAAAPMGVVCVAAGALLLWWIGSSTPGLLLGLLVGGYGLFRLAKRIAAEVADRIVR